MYQKVLQAETGRPSRWDPFQGHVRGWQALVFVYVLLTALQLAAVGIALWQGFTSVDEADTEVHTVSFVSWGRRGKSTTPNFYTPDGARYLVSYAAGDRLGPVKAACGTGETFVVRVEADSDHQLYHVYGLTSADGREVYVDFATANAERQRNGFQGAAIFVALLMLWLAFVIRSIQVGRHPGRYSEETIRRYFRADMVR